MALSLSPMIVLMSVDGCAIGSNTGSLVFDDDGNAEAKNLVRLECIKWCK